MSIVSKKHYISCPNCGTRYLHRFPSSWEGKTYGAHCKECEHEFKFEISKFSKEYHPIFTLLFLVINLVVYFFITGAIDSVEKAEKYGLSKDNSSNVLSYISSMFVHANLTHLLLNFIGLFGFGIFIERNIGNIKFLILYFLSGLIGGVIHITTSSLPVVGASGSIFGLLGLLTLTLPLLIIDFLFIIRMPIIIFSSLYLSIALLLGSFGYFDYVISHGGHLGGMFTGMIFAFFINFHRTKEVVAYWTIIFFCILLLVFGVASRLVRLYLEKIPLSTIVRENYGLLIAGAFFIGVIIFIIEHLKQKGYDQLILD